MTASDANVALEQNHTRWLEWGQASREKRVLAMLIPAILSSTLRSLFSRLHLLVLHVPVVFVMAEQLATRVERYGTSEQARGSMQEKRVVKYNQLRSHFNQNFVSQNK
jgi:hypothetical protein